MESLLIFCVFMHIHKREAKVTIERHEDFNWIFLYVKKNKKQKKKKKEEGNG
jgi:hypothetical protein